MLNIVVVVLFFVIISYYYLLGTVKNLRILFWKIVVSDSVLWRFWWRCVDIFNPGITCHDTLFWHLYFWGLCPDMSWHMAFLGGVCPDMSWHMAFFGGVCPDMSWHMAFFRGVCPDMSWHMASFWGVCPDMSWHMAFLRGVCPDMSWHMAFFGGYVLTCHDILSGRPGSVSWHLTCHKICQYLQKSDKLIRSWWGDPSFTITNSNKFA